MVAEVEKVFAVLILTGTAIREVDDLLHSCKLCSEEVDEVFLEEVHSNGVMYVTVRNDNITNM